MTRALEVLVACALVASLVVVGAYLLSSHGRIGPTPDTLAQGGSPTVTAALTTTSARCIWDLIPQAGRSMEDADKRCP
jgi:ABC-type molybdate transport system permease subunit